MAALGAGSAAFRGNTFIKEVERLSFAKVSRSFRSLALPGRGVGRRNLQL